MFVCQVLKNIRLWARISTRVQSLKSFSGINCRVIFGMLLQAAMNFTHSLTHMFISLVVKALARKAKVPGSIPLTGTICEANCWNSAKIGAEPIQKACIHNMVMCHRTGRHL